MHLLIQSIDTPQFYLTAIKKYLYKKELTVTFNQHIPPISPTINVEVATILPNFETVIANSTLVISHGGAGIIPECLKHKKKVMSALTPH